MGGRGGSRRGEIRPWVAAWLLLAAVAAGLGNVVLHLWVRHPTTIAPLAAPRTPLLLESDSIYRLSPWSPFVLERQRLGFFTVPKVGCTVFKQLFRRMEGYDNWDRHDNRLPHDARYNGLRLLKDFPLKVAETMLVDDSWTRAIFVRDPKERLLSAYLDKGRKAPLMERWCCPSGRMGANGTAVHGASATAPGDCGRVASTSFEGFLSVAGKCINNHWEQQERRMERKFWSQIDFVGHLESASEDVRRLLVLLSDGGGEGDLWERFGASGWGNNGTEGIFHDTASIKHSKGAGSKLREYYTPGIEAKVEDLMWRDYAMGLFNFTKAQISSW